jgi:hypothetical protein
MSRLGKMPHWQKWFVTLGMLTCSVTGSLYLLGHDLGLGRAYLGTHKLLASHGIAAILATMALGSVLPFHLKAGFKSKTNFISGFGQLSALVTLILTGALLYYGPESIRETTIYTHWIIGLLFFGLFLLHAPILAIGRFKKGS